MNNTTISNTTETVKISTTMPVFTTTTTEELTPYVRPRPHPEDFPKIAPLDGYPPTTSRVVFVYFLGVPCVVLFLYILWTSWQKFILWCDSDPNMDENEGLYTDDDIETGVIESVLQVAPILTKLPPDFNFPTCFESTDKGEMSEDVDVLRSSNGSLISLPLMCNFKLLPCYKKKSTKQLGENWRSVLQTRSSIYSRVSGNRKSGHYPAAGPPRPESHPDMTDPVSNFSKYTGRRMSLWPTEEREPEPLDWAKTANIKHVVRQYSKVGKFFQAVVTTAATSAATSATTAATTAAKTTTTTTVARTAAKTTATTTASPTAKTTTTPIATRTAKTTAKTTTTPIATPTATPTAKTTAKTTTTPIATPTAKTTATPTATPTAKTTATTTATTTAKTTSTPTATTTATTTTKTTATPSATPTAKTIATTKTTGSGTTTATTTTTTSNKKT